MMLKTTLALFQHMYLAGGNAPFPAPQYATMSYELGAWQSAPAIADQKAADLYIQLQLNRIMMDGKHAEVPPVMDFVDVLQELTYNAPAVAGCRESRPQKFKSVPSANRAYWRTE